LAIKVPTNGVAYGYIDLKIFNKPRALISSSNMHMAILGVSLFLELSGEGVGFSGFLFLGKGWGTGQI